MNEFCIKYYVDDNRSLVALCTMLKFMFILFIMMSLARESHSYYDDFFLPQHEASPKGADNIGQPIDYEDGFERSRIAKSEEPTGYTCGLCIVVDEEFSAAYNLKDGTALKTSLNRMVEHASWIFRSTDWDNNGTPDNIGFKVTRVSFGWTPYKRETKEHYETPKSGLELLKIFARMNFSKCCLGVGFTNRPFMNGQDGISFGASDHLLGGICDHRNPREEMMANMNVILVSGRGLNKSQLTSYQLVKAFLHELGHSFGVYAHDDDYSDPKCWGFDSSENQHSKTDKPTNGRYIMWARSYQAYPTPQMNSMRFSPCSKASAANILNKRKLRKKCFELDFNPFCGNGIVEGVEMCDCGDEYTCSMQKCCGSRKTDKPCMMKDPRTCPQSTLSKAKSLSSSSSVQFNVEHNFCRFPQITAILLLYLFVFDKSDC